MIPSGDAKAEIYIASSAIYKTDALRDSTATLRVSARTAANIYDLRPQ